MQLIILKCYLELINTIAIAIKKQVEIWWFLQPNLLQKMDCLGNGVGRGNQFIVPIYLEMQEYGIKDQFQWDFSNKRNCPQLFARQYLKDLETENHKKNYQKKEENVKHYAINQVEFFENKFNIKSQFKFNHAAMKIARAIRQQCYEHLLRTLKYNIRQRMVFNELTQNGIISVQEGAIDKQITKEFNQLKKFTIEMNKKLQRKQLLQDSEKQQFLRQCKRKSKLKKFANNQVQRDRSVLIPYINSVREPQIDPMHHQFTSQYLYQVPNFPFFKKNFIYFNGAVPRLLQDFIKPDTLRILNRSGNNYFDQETDVVSYNQNGNHNKPLKIEVFQVQRQHSMNVITSLRNNNDAVKKQKQAKKIQIQGIKQRLHQIKEQGTKSQKMLRNQQKIIAKEEMRIKKIQVQSHRNKEIVIRLDKKLVNNDKDDGKYEEDINLNSQYIYDSTIIRGEIKSVSKSKEPMPLLLKSSQDNRIKISLLNNHNFHSQEQEQQELKRHQDQEQDDDDNYDNNEDDQYMLPVQQSSHHHQRVSIPIPKIQQSLKFQAKNHRNSLQQPRRKGGITSSSVINSRNRDSIKPNANLKDYFPIKAKQDKQLCNNNNNNEPILPQDKGLNELITKKKEQPTPEHENNNLTIQINLTNFNIK